MRFEPFDWYHDALYYDIVFDVETEDDADFLEAVANVHGRSRGRRVLEPACGSGRLIAEMARRGWRGHGFDLADGSLRFARERLQRDGLKATLTNQDMTDFRVRGSFDLAHCLVSTFKYLPTDAAARAHLGCVTDALAIGGVYVLGLHLTDYSRTAKQRERWLAARDDVDVVCNIQSWPPDRRTRTERVRSRMTVTEAGAVRRLESSWTFRTYDLRQLKALLRQEPRLEHVATYGFGATIDEPIAFDGGQDDNVLILRRVR